MADTQQQELLDVLRDLRIQHPDAGVKALLTKLKEQRPACTWGAKEVRHMLSKIEAEIVAAQPPTASLPVASAAAPASKEPDVVLAEVGFSASDEDPDMPEEMDAFTAMLRDLTPLHEKQRQQQLEATNWAATHLHVIEPRLLAGSRLGLLSGYVLMIDLRLSAGQQLTDPQTRGGGTGFNASQAERG